MNRPRRALIVGGGIAGPALALFLARSKIESIVFEAYPRKDDVGAAFQIAPNGMRVLRELGLADSLLKAGQPSTDMAFRNHHGRQIALVHTGKAGVAVNVFRSVAQRVLRDATDRNGVEVRYGKQLKQVGASGGEVVATFEDGSTEVGDFLVGADGVRSRVRSSMFPDESVLRDTEMISVGGFCARDVTPAADARDASRLTFVVGRKHQFGYSRMDERTWAWWCHAHAPTGAEREALLKMPRDELRTWTLERYRGWCDPVESLIRATESWLLTPIRDVPRLARWHHGRTVLIGDAAHAMSPAAGQGASLALEDAMVLARLLADPACALERAFSRFEAIRRPRAEALVAQGYQNDRRSLNELSPIGMWTRDHLLMPLFARFIERALNKVYSDPIAA